MGSLGQLSGVSEKCCTINGVLPQPQQSSGMAGFLNHDPISPTFPPQFIDIPDIAADPFGQQQQLTHSPYQNGIVSYHSPYQQQTPYHQNIMFSQALQQHQINMMHNGIGTVMPSHMAGQSQMNQGNGGVDGGMGLHPGNGQYIARTQNSPVRSNTTSPGKESSEESDDSLSKNQVCTR